MTSLIRSPKTAFNGSGAAPTPGTFLFGESKIFPARLAPNKSTDTRPFPSRPAHRPRMDQGRRRRHDLAVRGQAQAKGGGAQGQRLRGAPREQAVRIPPLLRPRRPAAVRRLSGRLAQGTDFRYLLFSSEFATFWLSLRVCAWIPISMSAFCARFPAIQCFV